jgi:hypothetical protein
VTDEADPRPETAEPSDGDDAVCEGCGADRPEHFFSCPEVDPDRIYPAYASLEDLNDQVTQLIPALEAAGLSDAAREHEALRERNVERMRVLRDVRFPAAARAYEERQAADG